MNRRDIDLGALPGAEERAMLRDSMRGFLETHWPAATAVARSGSSEALANVWKGLVGQGVASLGSEPTEGGLREIVVVMEELGRAACPVPMLGAALANLALAGAGPREAGRATNASAGSTWGANPAASTSGPPAGVTDSKGGATSSAAGSTSDPPSTGRGINGAAAVLLDRLHDGSARIAFAFGALDPDRHAGAVTLQRDSATGTLRFVDAACAATHLLIASAAPAGLVVVEADASGIEIVPTRALGADGLAEVRLDRAPFTFVSLTGETLADLQHVARLALLARAHGAAWRAFEMVVDYAKERRQFGQPIGRFQAIQHKLANGLIALEGVRLTLEHAAAAFDEGVADWRYFAAAAAAFGGPALRQVSLETHHAFGAIGYAEDHEAPRHFRRAHLDTLALGGPAPAREALAAHLLDDPEGALPEYDLGEAGNAFRSTVREWLAKHWSGERKAAFDRQPFETREFDPTFARDLGATGWLGLGWPREFGGQARTPLEQLAFIEMMERAEAPRIGAAVQANALMMFGTPEQQARYLPEILAGEAMHGMGYSEPDAGSDLAALRTRARRDGDEWVIDGQKIWTTTWWGKYMFLAARTDPDAKPPHAGISMFIVPMDAPGITVKPSKTMYDGSFANIFYDGVRVPADALIGPVNGGWKVLTDALANERGLVGGGIVLKVAHAFELLCRDVRDSAKAGAALAADPRVRERIGTLAAEIEVGRQLMIHCAGLATSGTTPPELGAISKVFSGELMERFGEAALEILGLQAALSQDAAGSVRNGRYEQGLRHSLMWVISIGTNEIQRNLIAQRGLGLPR